VADNPSPATRRRETGLSSCQVEELVWHPDTAQKITPKSLQVLLQGSLELQAGQKKVTPNFLSLQMYLKLATSCLVSETPRSEEAALNVLHSSNGDPLKALFSLLSLPASSDPWTAAEANAFVSGLAQHKGDLGRVAEESLEGRRTMAECIHFYHHWRRAAFPRKDDPEQDSR